MPLRPWAPSRYYCRDTHCLGYLARAIRLCFRPTSGPSWKVSTGRWRDPWRRSAGSWRASTTRATRRTAYGFYPWGDTFHWAWANRRTPEGHLRVAPLLGGELLRLPEPVPDADAEDGEPGLLLARLRAEHGSRARRVHLPVPSPPELWAPADTARRATTWRRMTGNRTFPTSSTTTSPVRIRALVPHGDWRTRESWTS